MNTNELIQRLSRNLTPVEPLWRPGRRAFVWLIAAAVYVAALTMVLANSGAGIDFASPRVWLPHAAAIAASLLASWAAFASVVPGRSRWPAVFAVTGAIAWLAAVLLASRWDADAATIVTARHEIACVGFIVLGGAPMLAAIAAMLRRGASFTPGTTAAFAALAVGVLTNIGACFWRPHAIDDVTLAWHGGAIVMLLLACSFGARLFPSAIGAPLDRSV